MSSHNKYTLTEGQRSHPRSLVKALHFPVGGGTFKGDYQTLSMTSLFFSLYTRYWYIWDSLNGTLDKIWHGTWDNVYLVTKN